MKSRVMISGAGIGGLATALTLNQIGVECVIFEADPKLRPSHVGINLQPNAVRELFDLGFTEEDLDEVGIATREFALVGLNGNDVYAEPRGIEAGYNWPQYSVLLSVFKQVLYDELVSRAGPDVIRFGAFVAGYDIAEDGSAIAEVEHEDGAVTREHGALLIAAEGTHSATRAQMHPDQPPMRFRQSRVWQGITRAKPIRTGASFVGFGNHRHRFVMYPISMPDEDGRVLTNWFIDTRDPSIDVVKSTRVRVASPDEFVEEMREYEYDWIDIPSLVSRADVIHEMSINDRDPLDSWVDGPVGLLANAAHPMYLTGSNGPSQTIVDARVLGASILKHGLTPAALKAYDDELCETVATVILRNRGEGPFAILDLVDERCGGRFDDIDDVIPPAERMAFMAGYKATAGFAVKKLNSAAPTIAPGEKLAHQQGMAAELQ